jgi:S-adenosylmethionine:tRNA ribosyltransferase-isomerase
VGIGTFAPVRVWNVEKHSMEPEWVVISGEVAHHIANIKQKGGRIIAVGTTTTRALESASDSNGRVLPGQRVADLFIYPPYRFRVVDGLVTNFHLPRSTLIMLVSAFAGREFVMRTYQEAIERKYRFYSYGDAMLIL